MPKYNTRYIRANGEDKDLLMQRQFFGSVGPWQDCAYYNNEVYRSQAKMNDLYAEYCEEYAKQDKLVKKRNQHHRSIESATFQHEGVGTIKEGVKLPFLRKDKKPLVKPPTDWLKFASVIKHDPVGDGSLGLATKVTLKEDTAGTKEYPIEPTKQNNQSNKNHRRSGQQNGQN